MLKHPFSLFHSAENPPANTSACDQKTTTSPLSRLFWASPAELEKEPEPISAIKSRVEALKALYPEYEKKVLKQYQKIIDSFHFKFTKQDLPEEHLGKLTWYLIEGLYENLLDARLGQARSLPEIFKQAVTCATVVDQHKVSVPALQFGA